MRCLLWMIAALQLLAVPAWAQVTFSIGQSRALPGQPIDVLCSVQEREDYQPTRIEGNPFLIMPDGRRIKRGGIRGSDLNLSRGGRFNFRLKQLRAGDCTGVYAPLVPGRYEYDVTVSVRGKPDETPFTLSITVDPLPPAPGTLIFNRITTNKWQGWRMAEFTLNVPEARCYPESLNPHSTQLIVYDATTGRTRSPIDVGSYMEYPAKARQVIDQYNCVPSGTIVDEIRAPEPGTPGDWHIALYVKDGKTPLCKGKCRDGAPLNVDGISILAVTAIENIPREPRGEFYFERQTPAGIRPSAEASIGERVRVVLTNPEASEERSVIITAGQESRLVALEPDGELLASDWFVLGLAEDTQ